MGTSYVSVNGRMLLDCAQCGRGGEVRKRPCPVVSRDGMRYCPAVQLCGPCYSAVRLDGTWRDWHKDCKAGSDQYQAERDAREREPERYARSASGDWKPGVPKGMVEVTTYAGTVLLMPKDKYNPSQPLY